MKKLSVLMITIIFLVSILTGCGGSKPSALVGNWLLEDGQVFFDTIEDFEFFKDGSGTIEGHGISWKTEKDRLFFTYESEAKAKERTYKISGETLTLTGDDGRNFIYKRSTGKYNDFGKWRSSIVIDPITDNKRIDFRTYSQNKVPLFIRLKEGKLEMYIDWGVDIDSSSPNVTLRIDDMTPETRKWSTGSNKKSSFYTDDVLQIVKSLLEAEQVTVRYVSSSNHSYTATFDVTGLKEIATKYNDDLNWF